jgi:hypothetical protein
VVLHRHHGADVQLASHPDHGHAATHDLAVARRRAPLVHPWHSVDSSTAVMSAAYGCVYEFDLAEAKLRRMDERRPW